MEIELGINNCFAVKRWPHPDEWSEIIARELDLKIVQHSLDHSILRGMDDDEATAIRRACDASGVRIDSVFTGLSAYSTNMLLDPSADMRDRAERYWLQATCFTAAIGARAVGGHVGSFSRRDADDVARRESLWNELRGRLRRLSGHARRHGVEALLVENMACDREPWQMSQVASLLQDADAGHATIALCLDVGHQCAPAVAGADADPYEWLAAMGARAAVIHLQQSDASGDHHWPFTAEHNEHGRIHGAAVLDALAVSGATALTLILEVIPPFEADDAQVLDELRHSVEYWRQSVQNHERADDAR